MKAIKIPKKLHEQLSEEWQPSRKFYMRAYKRVAFHTKTKYFSRDLVIVAGHFGKTFKAINNTPNFSYCFKKLKKHTLNLIVTPSSIYLEIMTDGISIIVEKVIVKGYVNIIYNIKNLDWGDVFDRVLAKIEKDREILISFEKALALYEVAKKVDKKIYKIPSLTKWGVFKLVTNKTNYNNLHISSYFKMYY